MGDGEHSPQHTEADRGYKATEGLFWMCAMAARYFLFCVTLLSQMIRKCEKV